MNCEEPVQIYCAHARTQNAQVPILSLLTILILVTGTLCANAQQSVGNCRFADESITEIIEGTFNKTLSIEDCSVRVNDRFRAFFGIDEQGDLVEIEIKSVGKAREYMTFVDFEAIIQSLDKIKSIGTFMKRSIGGVVTNQHSPVTRQYRHAFLKSWEVELFDKDLNSTELIDGFTTWYLRPIKGIVEKKTKDEDRSGRYLSEYFVVIEGCSYYTTETEYNRIEVGRNEEFIAAGPTYRYCENEK